MTNNVNGDVDINVNDNNDSNNITINQIMKKILGLKHQVTSKINNG